MKISYDNMLRLVNKNVMRLDNCYMIDNLCSLLKVADTKEDLDDIRKMAVAFRRYEDKKRSLNKMWNVLDSQYRLTAEHVHKTCHITLMPLPK